MDDTWPEALLPAAFYDSVEAYREDEMKDLPSKEVLELIQQSKKDDFRQLIGGLYIFAFLPAWFAFMFYAITELGVEVSEALMLGTATGIFLAAFKDMWQFLWRKS